MTEKQIEPAKTNNCCRKIRISKFKNLGVSKPIEVTLNRTLDKEKIGGVVWLVGPNGAGKSNILKAIDSVGKTPEQRNYPRSLDDDGIPSTSLIYYDHETMFDVKSKLDNRPLAEYDWTEALKDQDFEECVHQAYFNAHDDKFNDYPKLPEEDACAQADFLKNNLSREDALYYIDEEIYFNYIEKAKPKKDSKNVSFKDRYGYDPFPKIVWYKQQHIEQKDFRCDKDDPNGFFTRLLSSLKDGKGLEKVNKAYEKYEKTLDNGALRNTEKQLNDELRAYSDLFNKLFRFDKLAYSFQIYLYETKIAFGILQAGESRIIEDESDGFRWFFDFFFNFRCGNKLSVGDIVLLEEPGTALHNEGRAEFSAIIREYARTTGLTFVMSTHESCMLDPDYMDDVRIIFRRNKYESDVYDKFTVVDQDSPDQLNSLLKALTVGRHAILDPKYDVVFVEGITDYNYLTAFKILFGKGNIRFLPVNGLGDVNDDDRKKKIIECLMSISRAPILLVDGDGAGKRMSELCQNTGVTVRMLSEVKCGTKIVQIEDTFDKNDYATLGLSKEWHATSIFKQYIKTEKLSENTINNFKAIFTMLEEDL
ncbi:MAG: AAA family ATPase [Candidatus Methanomethylophilaceae archaeon]|nr:AAA family ATPase [Candidatus Methanomethylophilaceae archaeon]